MFRNDLGRERFVVLHKNFAVLHLELGRKQAVGVDDCCLAGQGIVDTLQRDRLDMLAPGVVGKRRSLKNRRVRTLHQQERAFVAPDTATEKPQVIRSGNGRVEFDQRARQKRRRSDLGSIRLFPVHQRTHVRDTPGVEVVNDLALSIDHPHEARPVEDIEGA